MKKFPHTRTFRSLAACLGFLGAILLPSCSDTPPKTGVLTGEFREVEDFTLTTQNGEALSKADLKGKVWVANFIFTTCAAECLVLSSRLAELQREFSKHEDVAFVSYSVDPQTDTPERLGEYAKRWHANPEVWHFLTGDPSSVDHIVTDSFLLPVTRGPEEAGKLKSETFIHSNRLAIVDRKGKVRAYVDGLPKESPMTVSRILVQLLNESYDSSEPKAKSY